MKKYKYIYGPVPSRRMGSSLGISPIPEKTCNYSCVYCQLGRTNKMTNEKKEFFPLEDIVSEMQEYKTNNTDIDVVTIVGEGEPTLYSRLGELIKETSKIFNKPVAVITNGALLYDENTRTALCKADIVLPSIDAYNNEIFRKVDRPIGTLDFKKISEGLISFSKQFQGELMLEIMLLDGINNSKNDIKNFKEYISKINYDKLYINTPVRPPAESNISVASEESIKYAVEELNGISIDMLASGNFYSDIDNPFDAVMSIISRHPMSEFELDSFLNSRNLSSTEKNNLYSLLEKTSKVNVINYKGYKTYRGRKS